MHLSTFTICSLIATTLTVGPTGCRKPERSIPASLEPVAIVTRDTTVTMQSATAEVNAPFYRGTCRIDLSELDRIHPCRSERVVEEWRISVIIPLPVDTGTYQLGRRQVKAGIIRYRDGSEDYDHYEISEGYLRIAQIDTNAAGTIRGVLKLESEEGQITAQGTFVADFCNYEPRNKFLKRPLSGVILGRAYEYRGAVFRESFDEYASNPHSFRISFSSKTEAHCRGNEERPGLRIRVEARLEEKTFSESPMGIEILSKDKVYVTPRSAVKITHYDSTGNTIAGVVDAYWSDSTYLNGRFDAVRCE